jgi:serine/threonine protein phosphatase 1
MLATAGKETMSLVAIGDIHGNVRALDDLLEKVLPVLSAEDTLVFLGDYIDRGPNVRECVDRIIELKSTSPFSVVTLLGNHEDWMLKSYRDHTAHSWIVGMESFDTIASYSPTAADVLRREIEREGISLILAKSELSYSVFFDALPPSHLLFFESLQYYHRKNGILCVHGGLDTTVGTLEAQQPDAFIWGCEDFPGSYSGEDRVVYGHHGNAVLDSAGWPHPNLKTNGTCGIDTISHGVLTAIRFPSGDVFQSRRFSMES